MKYFLCTATLNLKNFCKIVAFALRNIQQHDAMSNVHILA